MSTCKHTTFSALLLEDNMEIKKVNQFYSKRSQYWIAEVVRFAKALTTTKLREMSLALQNLPINRTSTSSK